MSWTLEFYRTATGDSPVEDWLDGLSPAEAGRAVRGLYILRTFGNQLGMPHVRGLEGSQCVFGLRRRGQPEHRMFFVPLSGQRFLILHAMTKQAYGTPPGESDIAKDRHQEYLKRMS